MSGDKIPPFFAQNSQNSTGNPRLGTNLYVEYIINIFK